jgi:hypothetical protein
MFIYRALKALFTNRFFAAAAPRDGERMAKYIDKVIICKTMDEMNIDLARKWCDEDGLTFQLAPHGEKQFPAGVAAIVIDLDHLALGPGERAHYVEQLAQMLPPYPVAIASYDLEPDFVDTLKARGLLVFRRLERQMFYDLANAIRFDGVEVPVPSCTPRWPLHAPKYSPEGKLLQSSIL